MRPKAFSNRLLTLLLLATTLLSSTATAAGEQKAAPAGSAQAKSVSGTWKMNAEKSKFGGGQGPKSITIVFDQQGQNLSETLTIVNPGGEERRRELKYTLDAKEGANDLGDDQVKSTARWEGDTLVIELKGGMGTFNRRFTLSENGKTMSMTDQRTESGAEQVDTVVLEKQ